MAFATHPQSSQPKSIASPDMDQWLKQHDLLYERAPEIWDEGMLLANGDIGAVLWFEGERLNISLDKLDLFETAPQTRVVHPDYHWSTLVAGLEQDGGRIQKKYSPRAGSSSTIPPLVESK